MLVTAQNKTQAGAVPKGGQGVGKPLLGGYKRASILAMESQPHREERDEHSRLSFCVGNGLWGLGGRRGGAQGGDGDLGWEGTGGCENRLLEARSFLVHPSIGTKSVPFQALPGAGHIRTHQDTHPRHAANDGWCQKAALWAACLSSPLLIYRTLRWTGLEEGLKTSPADHKRRFPI